MPRSGSFVRILCAVAIVAAFAGCSLFRGIGLTPKANVQGLHLEDVGLTSATLVVDVQVQNPYGVALPVTGLDYKVTSQGRKFLDGKIDLNDNIPAGQSMLLPIPLKVPYLALLEAIGSIKSGSTLKYGADLGLHVATPAIGSIRIPMKHSGEIPVPS